MAQGFRLEIGIPPPLTTSQGYYIVLTDDSHQVNSIECELRTEGKRISHLTCVITDPGMELFGKLPDPSFANVPVTLYMSSLGNPQSVTHLVFYGKVTSLQVGFPGPEVLTVVAHDLSIDARRQAKARTFKNKTSKQIVDEIIRDYGLSIDTSLLGDVTLVQRAVEIGMTPSDGSALSDW